MHPHFYDPHTGATYESAYRRIQEVAPTIVFVSEFTKCRFLELFPSNYCACHVIPLYATPSLAEPTVSKPRIRPFILMVEVLEHRKNYRAALKAFEKSGLARRGYQLVVLGPPGNLSSELLPLIAASDNMEHIGFVSERPHYFSRALLRGLECQV
jgi:hypothetical protein